MVRRGIEAADGGAGVSGSEARDAGKALARNEP